MSSSIQVRVDDELKRKSDSLFKELGTDTTSAIRIFLTQSIACNGFPFEIKKRTTEEYPYSPVSEDEMMEKLRIAKENSEQGKQREASAVISDMRSRYGI